MSCENCNKPCFNKVKCEKTKKYHIILLIDKLLCSLVIIILSFYALLFFSTQSAILLDNLNLETLLLYKGATLFSILVGCLYLARRCLKKDEKFYFLGRFALENKIF